MEIKAEYRFACMPEAALADPCLSKTAKLVLCGLYLFADKATLRCYPKIASLSLATAIPPRTIQRALAELRESGWVASTFARDYNVYVINKEKSATATPKVPPQPRQNRPESHAKTESAATPPTAPPSEQTSEQTKEQKELTSNAERERNGRVDARENAPFFLEDEHQHENEEKQNAQVTTETQQPVASRPAPPAKPKPTPTPQPTPDIQPPSMPGKDSRQHLMNVFEGIIWPIAIFCNHVTPGRSKRPESIARFLHHCRTLADAERLAESYDALKRCNEANDALHVMPGLQVFIGRKGQRPDWKTQDIVAQCSKATRTAQRRHVRLPDWQDNEGWEKLGRSVGVHADSYESWNTFKYDVKDAVRA